MASPRNMLEIVLIDRGFSKVNRKHFKKIFLPIFFSRKNEVDSHAEDPETPSLSEMTHESGEHSKNDFFSFLKKIHLPFGYPHSSFHMVDSEDRKGPLFLRVDSLPDTVRDAVFDCDRFDVENWESLNEGLMWLAWVRTSDVALHWREARQTAEFINILNTIKKLCMTREELFYALRLTD